MSNFISPRLARPFLLSFLLLVLLTSGLYPQEPQSNRPPERKVAAGIITKDQTISGPVWISNFLPVPDSSRIWIIKDAKGNEVKLTTKDLDLGRNHLYVPEGHKLSVDKGSYYWLGYSLTTH